VSGDTPDAKNSSPNPEISTLGILVGLIRRSFRRRRQHLLPHVTFIIRQRGSIDFRCLRFGSYSSKLTQKGTVVDWRKSVVDYLWTLPQPSSPLDHESFAQEWRYGYYLATREFAAAPDPTKFKTIDEIHLSILEELIKKYQLESIWNGDLVQEINLVWHRLHGWPDTTEGLNLLKKKFIIGTLSNGNARLLIDMAKFTDLPWDVIFSGDLLKAYKPNERMYLGACEYLQLPPEKVGML